jgi:hypothetical protein
VSDSHAELERRLATLAERFTRVSADLAQAGQGLLDHRVLPPEDLVGALAAVRADFDDLRSRVEAIAAGLAIGPTPPVTGIRELEVLLKVVTGAAARRGPPPGEEALATVADVETRRQAQDEEARRRGAEEEARRRAQEEARQNVAEEQARRKAADEEARRWADEEARRRVADVEARQRGAEEEARRRVAEAEARQRAAEDEARRRAEGEEEAWRQAGEEEARRKAAEEDARRLAQQEARRRGGEEEEARRRAAEEVARGRAEAEARRQTRPAAEQGGRRPPEEDAAPEPVAQAPAAEEEAADLGLDTARWWISATASWASMKSRKVAFADSVRDVVSKYPYVFSVPIQSSADYEDGLLAYGYAVLIDHLEQRTPGFATDALNRLPAGQGGSLGGRLYEYLAQPLGTQYPDFVRAVMLAALPRAALWVDGGVQETDGGSSAFTRPTLKIGDPNQKLEHSSQDRQRSIEHKFVADVAPLTTRFYRLEVGEVKEPRDVEVRLSEKGSPSDQAWLVSIPARGGALFARRQERPATQVSGLGRDASALWVALFNCNADGEKRFDLTLVMRRRAAGGAAFTKSR